MAHPPHDPADPDHCRDGMALIEAHALGDNEGAKAILNNACGTCVANFLAWLMARMVTTDPAGAAEGVSRLRDLALRGGE